MKAKQKSLQKLTDLELVQQVLAKKKIYKKDYNQLTPQQQELLSSEIHKINSNLKTVEEQNAFLDKIEDILHKDSRNQRWQNNHVSIQAAFTNLLIDCNRLPSVNEIAEHTKLSRQTVNKHLKNFDTQELYQGEWDKLRYAAVNVAGKVMKEAIEGNMKAARLFFDIINSKKASIGNTFIDKQQNNYLTINNVKLDEATLKSMPAELLQQIEEFVKIKRKNSENK
jgi:hypothetical protein